ncbi:unnamed protein product, partial [Musa acuminata var. zebrina]
RRRRRRRRETKNWGFWGSCFNLFTSGQKFQRNQICMIERTNCDSAPNDIMSTK